MSKDWQEYVLLYVDEQVMLDSIIREGELDAHAYYVRGNTLYERQSYARAVESYRRAFALDPALYQAAVNAGNAAATEDLQDYQQALAWYEQALQVAPYDAEIYYCRANVFSMVGMLEEALESYNHAITLAPPCSHATFNRASVLSRLHRHAEAFADYDQAFLVEQQEINTAWTVAWAHFGKDLSEDMALHLEQIATYDPSHYTSALCHAVILLTHADPRQALLFVERALLQPLQWDPHFWVGMIYASLGFYQQAQHAIENALKLGLPLLMLMPLFWLETTHPDFFANYARPLLLSANIEQAWNEHSATCCLEIVEEGACEHA